MSSNKRGFTLIEAVIAMALASAGLASVYQVYASAARAERASAETETAIRLAEMLFASGEPGTGEAEGFAWTVSVAPTPGFDGLEQVTLTLTTQAGRTIELQRDRPVRSEGAQ
ncbi:prepilin-type N-terminal cleavage/methylation domain-containing protein [Hyphobacterium sp. HN65]|uniref:Prepilin-type N-terminal cleavage/methylation domain-containing protein n=1 Tax=Hyphobacterium lacteum TaxID=3116575 RepID=A0ABU7LPM9_9PROT|nr:prepilin-type N-terminal cleavage/methylation domain-containing protein [Hyphobacterium sp. HN65]MEE2525564.1 prepilin-type N-terminal cleavage/methylation domain-containing protein [Hyphobacterium sp. HN65]